MSGKASDEDEPRDDVTWLWFWRTERGMRQADLAVDAEISRMQISRYERGVRAPRLSTARRIAGSLGVTVDMVFPPPDLPTPRDVLRQYAEATPGDTRTSA